MFGAGWLQKLAKKPWRLALLIWLMSFLVRLFFYKIFLANNSCQLLFDSGHYHEMACNLLEQGAFCDASGLYSFYRLPGYPLFLAACYKIFGVAPFAALCIQQLFAAVIPVQLFFFVASVWPHPWWAAMLVAIIGVLHIGLLIFSGLVMTETLFIFLFLGFLHVLVKVWQMNNWRMAFLAGLLLGLCNVVRPLIFFPLAVAALLVICLRCSWSLKGKVIGMYLLGWVLLPGLWMLRNWLLTGLWFLHTLSGPHLLNHGAVRVYAMANSMSCQQAAFNVQRQLPVFSAACKQQEAVLQSQSKEKYATRLLVYYWRPTLLLSIVNCIKTVCALYSAELLFIDSVGQLPAYDDSCNLWQRAQRFLWPVGHKNVAIGYICWLEIIFQALLLFGVVGYCARWLGSSKKNWLLGLLLGIAFMMISTTAICGFARLRLPIEPILIMVAVMFYVQRTHCKEMW